MGVALSHSNFYSSKAKEETETLFLWRGINCFKAMEEVSRGFVCFPSIYVVVARWVGGYTHCTAA